MADGGSVVLFEDITERKMAEAKINQLARYDSLTGLPNRALFRDQMDAAVTSLRRRGPFAIHFVDLDEFKQVNDTLGHPCGDELLCAVADRLRSAVRSSDVVARFGGDEFVILQYPLANPRRPPRWPSASSPSSPSPIQISGHEVVVGASIGIALAPRDGSNADLLLKNADMALYRAKSDGRRAWRFFEQGMDVMAQARRNLQLDLRNALADQRLQGPLPALVQHAHQADLDLRGAAALAASGARHGLAGGVHSGGRGDGADRRDRQLGPARGLPRVRQWPDDVRVAVNMSPIQFRRGNVADVIREALAAAKLPASRLEIEITESVLLNDTELTRHWLDQLQEMGVRISLDDFGTGYSSLSYLHSFPLQQGQDRPLVPAGRGYQRQARSTCCAAWRG